MAAMHHLRPAAPDARRSPVVHDEALQEAKRFEKMQTVCSSHRTSGTAVLPVILTKNEPR